MATPEGKKPASFWSKFIGPFPILWVLLIFLGVLLTVAGSITITSAGYYITPNPAPSYGQTCDRILVRNITLGGSIAAQAGLLLLMLGFFGAAATSPDLDRGLRITLFIGGVLILIFPFSIFRISPSSNFC